MSIITLESIKARAVILAYLRDFFTERGVIEIETPIMNECATTDVFLDSVEAHAKGRSYYLHTSPEHSMKKLLARHPVSMYQICKVFRDYEEGARHSVEFSMLEWYRVGMGFSDFLVETTEMLCELFPTYRVEKVKYADIFEKFFGFCPHTATLDELNDFIHAKKILDTRLEYKAEAFDLLFGMFVEPSLVGDAMYFVEEFPVEQSAMSKLKQDSRGRDVAERFEVFVNGFELVNGYAEETSAATIAKRIDDDLAKRAKLAKPLYQRDEELIRAHQTGLPQMVGASMGLDRLMMCYLGVKDIKEVMTFKVE